MKKTTEQKKIERLENKVLRLKDEVASLDAERMNGLSEIYKLRGMVMAYEKVLKITEHDVNIEDLVVTKPNKFWKVTQEL